jgi:transposase
LVVRDSVRVQNRIKSMIRSRGVTVEGKAVYGADSRKEYQEKLPEGTRAAVATLYAQYDLIEELRKRAEKELVVEARRHPASRILATCPGIGAIRAARLLPIVVTPHRFRTKRQFWSYCGLGIVMRSSADWLRDTSGTWQRTQMQQTRGLNLTHNHQLKAIFKGAATTVLMQYHDDPLYADYQRLLAGGTKPNLRTSATTATARNGRGPPAPGNLSGTVCEPRTCRQISDGEASEVTGFCVNGECSAFQMRRCISCSGNQGVMCMVD